jgi:MFS family permease
MITFPYLNREGDPDTRAPRRIRYASRRAGAALQSLPVGTDPLRSSRDFRLLWVAALPAGMAMGAVGLGVVVQLYDLTGSPAALGYLGLIQFGAMVAGALAGSAIVDHIDRRRLLVLTQIGFGLNAAVLLAGSLVGDPPVPLLYLTSAFGSAVASLHFPTRTAMIPPVVERDSLTTAMTLETVVWSLTMIFGPIVGGVLLDAAGLSAVYALGVVGHTVTLFAMVPLERQPIAHEGSDGLGLAAIRRGFAYLRPRPILRGLLWIDVIAMVFAMRRALLPVIAVEQFGRGAGVVGLLMAAIPAGALVVSLMGDWIARVHRQGLGVVVAAAVWGAAVALFGLSGDHLALGVLLLAIGGGADVVAAILRSTIVQHVVPTHVRGRVWGINFLVLNGGPRLGDLTGGLAASAWGVTVSVVAGGLAALVGSGLYALAHPELVGYTADDSIDPAT